MGLLMVVFFLQWFFISFFLVVFLVGVGRLREEKEYTDEFSINFKKIKTEVESSNVCV
jgi:hypothetical protein